MKTYTPKAKDITHSWHQLDAKDQILGRLASKIAHILQGKHKPTYSPNLDCGDYVVITNVAGIKVTGNKLSQKIYYQYSGYPGGLRSDTLQKVMDTNPAKALESAVSGMLPNNKLRDRRLRRLRIFVDNKHPYQDKFKQG